MAMKSSKKNKGQASRNCSSALETWPSRIPKGVDVDFVKTIFDITPACLPVTQRKMIFLALYLSMIGAVVWLEIAFSLSKKINKILSENFLWLTIITYGMEPFMLILYMILARYPYFDPNIKTNLQALPSHEDLEIERCDSHFNQDTVLVIPCHHSASNALEAQSLIKVIRAALLHFEPSHILVVNNGEEAKPVDNTEEIVRAIHRDIIYIYRRDGNKSRAQLNGIALAIAHYGEKIKYVLLIDDDVQIPEHYRLERAFFLDKHVRGVIYPILATSYDEKDNMLTRWQNMEYKLSDLTLAALDAFDSAFAPHGACVLLEIKTALEILRRHTGRFKGEDKEIGEILRNLYDVYGELHFRVDMAVHFKTVVPNSYLGYGNNLWKQRVRSWSEAPFLYAWCLVLKPLIADWRFALKALPIIKLTQSYHFISQCSHIFRYYIIALEARNPKFWLTFGIFSLVQSSVIFLFNYQKLPPYLRNDFISTATFPVYKNIDNAMSHIAFWRAILFSIPAEAKAETNLEKLESGLVPPLQVDYIQSTRTFSKTPLQKVSFYRSSAISEVDEMDKDDNKDDAQYSIPSGTM